MEYEVSSYLESIKDKYSFVEKVGYFPLSYASTIIELHVKKENYILLKLSNYNFKDKIEDEISNMLEPLLFSSCCSHFKRCLI